MLASEALAGELAVVVFEELVRQDRETHARCNILVIGNGGGASITSPELQPVFRFSIASFYFHHFFIMAFYQYVFYSDEVRPSTPCSRLLLYERWRAGFVIHAGLIYPVHGACRRRHTNSRNGGISLTHRLL